MLDGQHVVCVVIIQGSHVNCSVKVGIGVTIDPGGNPGDPGFFLKNSGPDKYSPDGPVCHYRGIEIFPMVRWSNSGSKLLEIYANVL